MNTKIKGGRGEALAAGFLKKKKYKILEMNYTAANGEIDIIALDKETVVFVEVKARQTATYGLGREAVTRKKQLGIARAATAYLQKEKLFGKPARFDVVEITGENVVHIENAFEV